MSANIRATELLRNRFGVSQLYKYEVKDGEEVVFAVYWHPLTVQQRESIQEKTDKIESGDFALSMLIEKALDVDGNRLFQDGERAALRRDVQAGILQEIELAMLNSGAEHKVEEAKAALKSK